MTTEHDSITTKGGPLSGLVLDRNPEQQELADLERRISDGLTKLREAIEAAGPAAQEAVDPEYAKRWIETARRLSVQLSNELPPQLEFQRPWPRSERSSSTYSPPFKSPTRPDRLMHSTGSSSTLRPSDTSCATRSTSTPGAAMTTLGRLWLICSRHSRYSGGSSAPRRRFDPASTAPWERGRYASVPTGIGSSPSATTSTRVEPGGGRRLVPPGAGGTRWSRTNRPRERPGLRKGACAPGETRASGAWRLNRKTSQSSDA